MKTTHLRLPLSLLLLGACSQPLHANVWLGSQPGKSVWWGTGANWTNAAPNNITSTTQNQIYFLYGNYGGAMTGLTDNVTVTGDNRMAYYLRTGLGKTVNITMNAGLTLNPGVASIFGTNEHTGNIGSGASTTNFQRTAAGYVDLKLGQFFVGYDLAGYSDGHAVRFSGELNVSDTGNTASSVVGFRGNNNQMTVENKARLDLHGLSISSSVSYMGNLVTVTGSDSLLNVRETLSVGSNASPGETAQETYDGATRLNRVLVSNGAKATIKTLAIGRAENARSNSLHVEGEGSEVTVSASTFIGSTGETSLGGNEVNVGNGGVLNTGGAVFVAGFKENGGFNDGANRLSIAEGGTMTATHDIEVGGLLQLAAGGTLQAAGGGMAVHVKGEGRFEAEGGGLGSQVSISLESGGTFAPGVGEGRTSATVLQLDSTLASNDGILELTAWSSTSIDQIEFLDGGSLTGTITLTINPAGFAFTEGDQWTLFTGNTSAIAATFDLSRLGFPVDTSLFNQEGGWRLGVAAIPEPSTYVFVGTGALLLAAWRRRHRV